MPQRRLLFGDCLGQPAAGWFLSSRECFVVVIIDRFASPTREMGVRVVIRVIPAALLIAAVALAQQNPGVQVEWDVVLAPLNTRPTCQVVVNPLLVRGSHIHGQVFANLRTLVTGAQNLGPIRFVPWLPYPRLGVAALDPPSGSNVCGFRDEDPTPVPVILACPVPSHIVAVDFASFGLPSETYCGNLSRGPCHAPASLATVTQACVGKQNCTLEASVSFFGGVDPCPGTPKRLAVQLQCSAGSNVTYWDFTHLDPLMEDFMGATAASGAEVIINFSTPPTWLYDTAGVRVSFPDQPLGETWGYEQGTQLVDPTATAIGQYYGRLLAHYTDGGFTDEGGVFHPGYLFNISHWEVRFSTRRFRPAVL
jgi:hypothetical protein